jgi:DNA polymerase-1
MVWHKRLKLMAEEKTPPVILIDGSSYLFRAFHALPPLENSRGQPTGAIKGVISMIRRMLNDYPGSPVGVVFDAKGKTFRNDIYPEYKANRPPMPDELREQIKPIHQIVEAMGLPLLIVDDVEADDVIGTLATQANEQGVDVVISTGDKDMAQLVGKHVTLVNTMTDTVMDYEGVKDKYGIPPELIIDYLALTGDKSDNIPGVAGVGDKTALALLQGIGGLDQLFENLDKIPELGFRGAKSMPAKLQKEKEMAYLSYQLATIKTDVALDWNIDRLHRQEIDKEILRHCYEELEFKGWLAELLENESVAAGSDSQQAEAGDYHIILEEADFEQWLQRLKSAELFAFDTETTSLRYMEARVVGVSFAVKAGEAAYVPFGHDYLGAPEQLNEEFVLGKLKPLLEDPQHYKLGQNLKYDRAVLANHGIKLQGIAFDTMLESYVLNSTASRHDMDSLALKYLGLKTVHFEEIAGKGSKQLSFNQIKLEEAGPYAAEDADITLRLHQVLYPQVEQEGRLKSVLTDLEVPLISVLADIERTGALVDGKLLAHQSIEIGKRLEALEKSAYELAGEAFNLSSPKQLGEILFNKLELPVLKKTPKGVPSTAEAVLAELALDYPLPKLLMEYRGLAKLKSTYTDKLPEMINPVTGRIHTSYHQAVTATGRLSSSDPNLQNIPIRSEEGRRIRQAFIAPEGYCIVAADYSQIELRIMAHLSQDKGLLTAFAQGLDVHKATAAEVFSVDLEQVSAEMRRSAKAINFGLIYGMSAFGLARQLNVGRKDAQEYIDLYFERYPGVKRYMDDIREKAHTQGYVETLFGRRLYLPEINARNKMRQQAAERTAINAPMQGTAADIIKLAMISIHRSLQDDAVDARIIMQVHDELVLEVENSILNEVKSMICQRMESAAQLDVPLLVEAGSGKNWDQAH